MITKEEYFDFLKINDDLCDLINKKTVELCRILYDRCPTGVYCSSEQEFEIYENEISVSYEEWSCGERCYDQFKLPIEFLFDINYPEEFKKIHEENVKKKEDEKLRKKKENDESNKKKLEEFERKEYKRLKNKFEKDDCKLNKEINSIYNMYKMTVRKKEEEL